MKKRIYILIGVACSLLWSGCRSSVAPASSSSTFVEPLPLPALLEPAFAEITLIRIEPEPADQELRIYERGEWRAVLGNQSFVTFPLPAGTNTLIFDWEDTPLQFEEMIVLDADTERFVTIHHRFDVPEISKQAQSTDYTMVETMALFELPKAYGKAVIETLDPSFSFVFERE